MVMKKAWELFRKEPVLMIAAAAAVISCFFVPPDREYLNYIDLRTIALLYCLMTVVGGLRGAGLFEVFSQGICRRAGNLRVLGLFLVLLCFFSSMLVTNDVALLTFVPFAIAVLTLVRRERRLILIVVMQTVAANLGSMLTPIGNPQNLFLYSYYGYTISGFIGTVAVFWGVSLLLITAVCVIALPAEAAKLPRDTQGQGTAGLKTTALTVYAALFAVCMLVVLRVLPWWAMLAVVAAVLFFFDRRSLVSADFMLLLTFVAFFVFSGNLARIEKVDSLLRSLLEGREFLTGVLASQVISNVPAALLLSGFTDSADALLLGVNIGGLGTPIASLASLIGMKLYFNTSGSRPGRYLAVFTLVNVAFLIILSVMKAMLS